MLVCLEVPCDRLATNLGFTQFPLAIRQMASAPPTRGEHKDYAIVLPPLWELFFSEYLNGTIVAAPPAFGSH